MSNSESHNNPSIDTYIDTITVEPRFCETDLNGHINNVTFSIWAEHARVSFTRHHPALTSTPAALVKLEIDFFAEALFGDEVKIDTCITTCNNSSFVIQNNFYQYDQLIANSKAVCVQFDPKAKKSIPFTQEQKDQINKILVAELPKK